MITKNIEALSDKQPLDDVQTSNRSHIADEEGPKLRRTGSDSVLNAALRWNCVSLKLIDGSKAPLRLGRAPASVAAYRPDPPREVVTRHQLPPFCAREKLDSMTMTDLALTKVCT